MSLRLLALTITLSIALPAAAAESWIQKYTTSRMGWPAIIAATADGGAVIATTTEGLLRVDAERKLLWARDLDLLGASIARVLATPSGIFLAGHKSKGSMSIDGWVLLLDGEGNEIWSRTIGGRQQMLTILGASAASDGGFVITGGDLGSTGGAFVAKLGAKGELRWKREFDASESERTAAVAATPDGGFIAVGDARRCGWVVKLKGDGTVEWQNGYCGDGLRTLDGVAPVGGGGYVAVGNAARERRADADLWLLRLGARGEVLWQQAARGDSNDAGHHVFPVKSGFVVAGTTRSFGGDDLWLLAFGADGAPRWQRRWASEGGSESPAAAALSGERLFAGLQIANDDWRLLHLDANGLAPTCAGLTTETTAAPVYRVEGAARPFAAEVDESAGVVSAAPLRIPLHTAQWSVERACSSAAASVAPAVAQKVVAPDDVFAKQAPVFDVDPLSMLAAKKFAELDLLAARLLASKERDATGEWKLRTFHEVLAAGGAGDRFASWKPLMNAWIAASVEPTVPRAILAMAHRERAWQARGPGLGDSVTPNAAGGYELERAAALKALGAIQSSPDPAFYDIRMRLAGDDGDRDEMMMWFTRGLQVAVGYDQFYYGVLNFLRPQWFGSLEESVAFVDQRVPGDVLYAHLARQLTKMYDPGVIKKLSWARIARGIDQFAKSFPRATWRLHDFALLAYRAGDRRTAARLFALPALQWTTVASSVWDKRGWEEVRAWATSTAGPSSSPAKIAPGAAPKPAAKARSASPAPAQSAPVTPPITPGAGRTERITDGLVKDWPQLVLRNEVRVAGVTAPASLTSFLIRYEGKTYAVSSTCFAEGKITEESQPFGSVVVKEKLEAWSMYAPAAPRRRGEVKALAVATDRDPGGYPTAGVLLRIEGTPEAEVLEPRLTPLSMSEPVWVVAAGDAKTRQRVYRAAIDGRDTATGAKFGRTMLQIDGAPPDMLPGALLLDSEGRAVGVLTGGCRLDNLTAEDIGLLLERRLQ